MNAIAKENANNTSAWGTMYNIAQLLASLHHSGNYAGLLQWLPRLIERNPMEKRYWQQMAYAYLNLENECQAAAVLSAAYHNGVIHDPSDIKNLVQVFCKAGVPHKGAGLLEHALDNNRLDADAESYELLANTWLQAREIRRAACVLKKKAKQCGDCKTKIRLGQLLIQLEHWSEAIEYLQNAIEKQCKNQNEEALFLLGMAAFHSANEFAPTKNISKSIDRMVPLL